MGKVKQHKFQGVRKCCFTQPDLLKGALDTPTPTPDHLHDSTTFSFNLNTTPHLSSPPPPPQQHDFGGLVHNPPCKVVSPSSTEGVSSLVKAANASSKLTVTARGNSHSVHGQAQALNNGIVIDMKSMHSMASSAITVHPPNDSSTRNMYVEAPAGALWIDILNETLKHGLAPASWTDYLYLTLGGTLSNAGVSGQAFRHGPQISNVLQLEVVTGKGEIVTCSSKRSSELFYAVLGGLGQFGIITKAHILLEHAPERARYLRLLYDDFEMFRGDLEYLISRPGEEMVNYVEGIVVPNTDDPHQGWDSVPFQGTKIDPNLIPETSGPVLYCIEIAKYYNQHEALDAENKLDSLLASLSYLPHLAFSIDLTYFDFLNRVRVVEETLRKIHQWDVPHPWLTLFVPQSNISKFNDLVFKEIVSRGVNGPMLMYPLNRSKWDPRTSVVIPDESVFYIVGLLRYVVEGGQPLEVHLEQNAEILKKCESNGLGVKQYFPHYHTESEWKQHFGDTWKRFVSNKLKFDPKAVLCPGQRIFTRNKVASC